MRRVVPESATESPAPLEVRLFPMPWTLILIVLLAAALRFHELGHAPPGLHVDEASNIWNAWSLAKTGRDAAGERWPVFYFHSFGENRSALMLYALLPFDVAAGGPSVAAARAVGAAAGVAAVFCMFVVGRRLFDSTTGLLAALFLAVSPWHIQQSRWAHEATLVPLLVLLPLALVFSSNMFPRDEPARDPSTEKRAPGAFRALVAGLVVGGCCYGYPAVRVFLPVFLGAVFLVARPWRREFEKTRRRAAAAFAVGFALTFGPLAVRHLTDPAIGKRGATTWAWSPEDDFLSRAVKVAERYPAHFAPDFLFARGDPRIDLSPPPGYGLLFWWMLPLVLVGFLFLVVRAKSSSSARIVLCGLALYPAADLLNRYEGPSILRSLPGLPVFALLLAVGAAASFRAVASRSLVLALGAAAGAAVLAAISFAFFAREYFGASDARWDKYFAFQKDLLTATEWMRPRFEAADAVIVTGVETTHPDMAVLIGLGYDPARFLSDEKTVVPGPLPDGSYAHEEVVTRFGKFSFLFPDLPLPPALAPAPKARRLLFVVRPGELGLGADGRPDFEIRSPRDEPVLWCFDRSVEAGTTFR